jgi:hypothetical protein
MAVYDFIRSNNNEDCQQGATFERQITLKGSDGLPISLAGYTARMQIRADYDASDVVATPTIAVGSETITITLTAVQTQAIAHRTYVYDLELVNGASVERLLEGKFQVTPSVTRT